MSIRLEVVVLLLKKHRYSGYILFESLVALSVVTVILLQLIPLTLFVETKKQENRDKLEVYRYLSELASGFYFHGQVEFGHKKSSNVEIVARGTYTGEQLKQVVLEMDGETFEIVWYSEEEKK